MPKLVASYCAKVPGEAKYSSKGASASIEIDFDDLSTQGVAAKLKALWLCLRESVHEELGHTPLESGNGGNNGHRHRSNGYNGYNNHKGNGEPASKKQLGYLLSLCKQRYGFAPSDVGHWLETQHQTSLDSLSKRDAGRIIEGLKSGQIA